MLYFSILKYVLSFDMDAASTLFSVQYFLYVSYTPVNDLKTTMI